MIFGRLYKRDNIEISLSICRFRVLVGADQSLEGVKPKPKQSRKRNKAETAWVEWGGEGEGKDERLEREPRGGSLEKHLSSAIKSSSLNRFSF